MYGQPTFAEIDAGTYYINVQAMEDGQTGYEIRFGLETPEE